MHDRYSIVIKLLDYLLEYTAEWQKKFLKDVYIVVQEFIDVKNKMYKFIHYLLLIQTKPLHFKYATARFIFFSIYAIILSISYLFFLFLSLTLIQYKFFYQMV